MNTTQLKSFATEARKSLLSGVKSKMNALGFKDNGTVDERDHPMQAADGTLFQGEVYDVSFYGKWMRLKDEIARCGFRQVCEEGAYTWFNRLMAIQILSRNGLISPVLEFESPDVRIPLMVKQAHEGIRPEMTASDAARLNAVVDDDNRITEQFAILIVAYCQSMPILCKCFGALNDFTELLLPTNILASNGFMSLLNGSTFITQEDYQTTELIGWLYQFYIAERKDEVFASFKSGHKAEADDIPAATQIFTPNWIVKYMVQNTLGRIYLDNNPDSPLKASWHYLVEPTDGGSQLLTPNPQPSTLNTQHSTLNSQLSTLTFADLSCGSGHILGEAFDVLYAIYIEEGFSRRQAIRAIFEKNLTGVDIDTRARQLATFSLMLKACRQYPAAIDCEVMPRVHDMPQPDDPVCERYPILRQAHNLGSIMKIEPLPGETHPLVRALTDKYAAVVMNPPYMGSGNMNGELAKYVKDNYEIGKADLCTVFMLMQAERTMEGGYYANIVPPSWMFLSTFEALRRHIIEEQSIASLLHLSRGVFGADFGSVSTVVCNCKNPDARGTYFRLIERTFQEFDQRHLQLLFEKTLANHDFRYYFADYTKEVTDIVYSENGAKIYYPAILQSNFKKIPGCPIGYWVSEKVQNEFIQAKKMSDVSRAASGPSTGDTTRFLRLWHEVNKQKTAFETIDVESGLKSQKKWFRYDKGGSFRRWSGNKEYVVNWENNGQEIKNFSGSVIRNPDTYFKENIAWSNISSGGTISIRYFEPGLLYDVSAFVALTDNKQLLMYILGLGNSKVFAFFKPLLNPTFHFTPGDYGKIPFYYNDSKDIIILVQQNISISKQDWDAHETSWDFEENELVRVFKEGKASDLESAVEAYKEEWEAKFGRLHQNEEELNRQFIGIYGLEDELQPEVPLEEVTILQQGEITIEG